MRRLERRTRIRSFGFFFISICSCSILMSKTLFRASCCYNENNSIRRVVVGGEVFDGEKRYTLP